MAITSKERILKVLTALNPWWKTGVVNPKMAQPYKRFAFHEAMKRLDQTDIRRTVVLTGINKGQSGKRCRTLVCNSGSHVILL